VAHKVVSSLHLGRGNGDSALTSPSAGAVQGTRAAIVIGGTVSEERRTRSSTDRAFEHGASAARDEGTAARIRAICAMALTDLSRG